MIKICSKQELEGELKKNKQVLALFYASWCPYCMRFVPFFDDKVPDLDFAKVIHVLLDDNDNPLWDDYNISAVPTVILFENFKVKKRLDGRLGSGLKESQLVTWLDGFKQP
jgi:thioredoxin 1